MDQKRATVLAMRAAMLARITQCDVDEAIRYLAVRETFKDIDLERESVITGLPVDLIERLDAALLWYVLV